MASRTEPSFLEGMASQAEQSFFSQKLEPKPSRAKPIFGSDPTLETTIVILKLIFLLCVHSQLANFENSTAFPITFTELIQLWQLLIGNWVPLIHRKLYHQVKGRRKDSYLKSCLYATKELAFMAFQQSILGYWGDIWPY